MKTRKFISCILSILIVFSSSMVSLGTVWAQEATPTGASQPTASPVPANSQSATGTPTPPWLTGSQTPATASSSITPEGPTPTAPAVPTTTPKPSTISPTKSSAQSSPTTVPMLSPSIPVVVDRTSIPSAHVRQPLKLLSLVKRHLQAKDTMTATVVNAYDNDVVVTVRSKKDGAELPVRMVTEKHGDELTIKVYPPLHFRPGTYNLIVSDLSGKSQVQEFTWGVLAINTNKSIYSPKENADLAMAVLDEKGNMICNAYVTLDITSPNGQKTTLGTYDRTITINPHCKEKDFSNTPDYESHYDVPEETGTYQMRLTAETPNGIHTISDSFDVRVGAAFDIERLGPTRIYPVNNYMMTMKITAREDFKGTIVETVPDNFEISPGTGRPPDKIASVSANIGSGSVLGTQSPSIRMPFSGAYPQTLAFSDTPDDERLSAHYRRFGLSAHDGVDYAVPINTPIVAVDDGDIMMAGDGPYGITVIVKHSWGSSYYGHLNQPTVKVGQRVSKGDQIGLSGNTGLSTGPHIHFSIRPSNYDEKNGYIGKVNPLTYLQSATDSQVLAAFSSVQIKKELSWNIDISKGETITLGYQFDPPNISPQFYLLGPLRFHQTTPALSLTPTLGIASPSATIVPSVSLASPSATILPTSPASPSATLAPTAAASPSATLTPSLVPFASASAVPAASVSASPSLTVGEASSSSQLAPSPWSGTPYFQEARQWQIASDADVVIDATTNTDGNKHWQRPRLVFTNDSNGYMFYVNANGRGDYATTTDGGATWTSDLPFTAQVDLQALVVWYDQWTPGDHGTMIHILFGDSSADDTWYDTFDTNGDVNGTEVAINQTSNALGTPDTHTITKTTGGVLLAAANAGSSTTFLDKCSTNCSNGGNWTSVTNNLRDAQDYILLMPLPSNNAVILRVQLAQNDLEYDVWNASTNAFAGFVDLDNATNATQSFLGTPQAVVSLWNHNIYASYVHDADTNDTSEVRGAFYNAVADTWSLTTDIVNATEMPANRRAKISDITMDQENGDVYVMYLQGNTALANEYYKVSSDGMNTWTTAAIANTSHVDELNSTMFFNKGATGQIYFVYRNVGNDDLSGNTLVNLDPPIPEEMLKHGEWWSRSGVRRGMTF